VKRNNVSMFNRAIALSRVFHTELSQKYSNPSRFVQRFVMDYLLGAKGQKFEVSTFDD
jgi:hypothetical protein